MASLRIRNIGPLRDTGTIPLRRINLFIGKQSSGKSTFMKILSYCRWIEKQVMLNGEDSTNKYTHYHTFTKELLQFHRFDKGFFYEDSSIDYKGECVNIQLKGINKNAEIKLLPDFELLRHNTKLCFIPSERNLSTAIKHIDKAYKTKDFDSLFNFVFEWGEAKENYSSEHPLGLVTMPDMEYRYDKSRDEDIIRMKSIKKDIPPFYASSGIQSAMPIEVMLDYCFGLVGKPAESSRKTLNYLVEQWLKEGKTPTTIETQKTGNIVDKLLKYQSAQLFIEEPEQNLYPESQKDLVMKLVKCILNKREGQTYDNMLTITTHSPYLISVINVLIKAYKAGQKDKNATEKIIPKEYQLSPRNISAYFINDGNLKNITEPDIPMISGTDLDGVSDWVEGKITDLDDIIYG